MSYVKGRAAESRRLEEARQKYKAVIGSRMRGSKVSTAWIKALEFNPKIDLWYLTRKGKMHFENYKYRGRGQPKARIEQDEVRQLQQFADLFKGYEHIDVSYILKNAYKKEIKVKLN